MGILLAIFTAILWALFDVVRKKSLLFLTEVKVLLWIVVSQFIFFLIFLYFSEFNLAIKNYFLYAFLLILLNLIISIKTHIKSNPLKLYQIQKNIKI